ncbi:MAG TPA: hypothetical protein VNA57_14340 [Acidimicrobiales bacterium]|nr:hypothetical protein [Acidimicrobiales bacterium]
MTTEFHGKSRSTAVLLLWLTFLGGTLTSLHAVGGALAPPPLTDLGGMSGWMEERQPAEAAFALLRLVALATGWYLLAATVASTLARLIQVPVLVRFVDGLTVPAVRELVNAVAGASLATATLTTGASVAMTVHDRSARPPPVTVTALAGATWDQPQAAPIPDAAGEGADRGEEGGADTDEVTGPGEVSPSSQIGDEPAPAPAVVVRLPRQVGETTPPAETGPPEHPPAPAPPTLRRLSDDPEPEAPAPSPEAIPAPPAPSAPPASPDPPAPALELQPARWEIRAGQHLWVVAEAVLSSAWQRPPTDAEVDPYWRHLVETNRSILRDRSNPDLVYPGQVLTIPPPPAARPATEAPNLVPKAAP